MRLVCRQALTLGLLLAVGTSCEETQPEPSVLRTDSAGIEIATVLELPRLDDSAGSWRMNLLRVVASPPDNPTELPAVYDPQDGIETTTGHIVIRDKGPHQVVVFDMDSVVARLAPYGHGPGEIAAQGPILVARSDGTFYVVELWGNQRIHHFDVSGRLIADVRLDRGGGWPASVGRTANELTINIWSSGGGNQLPVDSVARVHLETGAVEPFAVLAPRVAFGSGRQPYQHPFGLWAAFKDGRVVVGRTDLRTFRILSERGALEREIRLPLTPRPLLDAHKHAIVEQARQEGIPGFGHDTRYNSHFRTALRLETVDDSLFALVHRGLLSGANDPELPDGQEVWRLISVSGVPKGVIVFPRGFSPWTVRGGRVLGAYRDSLGLASVRLYALERSTTNR